MSAVATVVVDGVDITPACIEGTVTHRLNRVSGATIRVQMEALADGFGTMPAGVGSMVKVYFATDLDSTPRLYHHGRVLLCETTCDEENGYSVLNSYDPLELWAHRPVRDWHGDFSLPGTINGIDANWGNLDGVNGTPDGPSMVAAMFANSEDTTAGGGGPPPADAEGPLRMALGTVVPGTTNLTGAPTDFPMTMTQAVANLVSTGELDVVCTPIEFDIDMNYGQLDLYPGNYGMDLSSSVIFQYGMGLYNVRGMRWNQNMSQMCNKLWYYLGPKQGFQHWATNITGDHPAFNPDGMFLGAWTLSTSYVLSDVVTKVLGGNTFYFIAKHAHTATAINEPGVGAQWWKVWDPWLVPPGGRTSPSASATDNQLGVLRYQSQQLYDVRMDIQVFDAHENEANFLDMYLWRWQQESWYRAQPQTIIHITPTRDTAIGDFDIGDLVLVEATAAVRGGFSGAQRVYAYSIGWDANDSVPAISELQVSSDAEGFS